MMLRQLIDKISIRRKCPLRKKSNTFKGFNNVGDNIENSNMPMSWGKEKENVAEKLFKEPMIFTNFYGSSFRFKKLTKVHIG